MKYFLYFICICFTLLITTSFKPKRIVFHPNPYYPFKLDGLYYTNQVLNKRDSYRLLFFYENGLNFGSILDSDTMAKEFDWLYYEQNYLKKFPKFFNSFCDSWNVFEQINNKIITTWRVLDGPFHHTIYSDTLIILNDTTLMWSSIGGEIIYKMQNYPKPDSTIFKPCNKYFKSLMSDKNQNSSILFLKLL